MNPVGFMFFWNYSCFDIFISQFFRNFIFKRTVQYTIPIGENYTLSTERELLKIRPAAVILPVKANTETGRIIVPDSYSLQLLRTPSVGANCYLFWEQASGQGILVDPGAGAPDILAQVLKAGVRVEQIVLTHGHYDHIGALDEVRDALKIPAAIHAADAGMLPDPKLNLSGLFGRNGRLRPAENLLADGDEIRIGDLNLRVLHTPGHSPGGICLLAPGMLLSGDTLFRASVGRTDFPGGDASLLLKSIREKLLVLDEATLVYPGHMEETSIGWEKRHNFFVRDCEG
jgi:glyoxylase-like metal-dependent hydrolase (beta-lactamase superfamily II)